MNNTTTENFQEYYITPYTFFTIFCFIWISGALCRVISGPFKLIYMLLMGLFNITHGIVILTQRFRNRRKE